MIRIARHQPAVPVARPAWCPHGSSCAICSPPRRPPPTELIARRSLRATSRRSRAGAARVPRSPRVRPTAWPAARHGLGDRAIPAERIAAMQDSSRRLRQCGWSPGTDHPASPAAPRALSRSSRRDVRCHHRCHRAPASTMAAHPRHRRRIPRRQRAPDLGHGALGISPGNVARATISGCRAPPAAGWPAPWQRRCSGRSRPADGRRTAPPGWPAWDRL